MGAGDCGRRLAVAEEDHRRDRHDPVAHGELLLLVDVQLHDLQLVRALLGNLLEDGGDGMARTTPLGPKIDEHGGLALEDVRLEGLVRH